MADLKDHRLIYLKGFLFLLGAILAVGMLLLEHASLRTALLLGLTIWCSARFYYFMFYVIEHYVDGQYRFAGVWSFVVYLLRPRSAKTLVDDFAKSPGDEAKSTSERGT